MSNQIIIATSDERVWLRQLVETDAEAFFALVKRNREHLRGYDDNDYADSYTCVGVARQSILEAESLEYLRFGIWMDCEGTDVLTGTIVIGPGQVVFHREFRSLGYWVGEEFCKQGLATKAAIALTDWAKENLEATWLIAQVMVNNKGSRKVIERTCLKCIRSPQPEHEIIQFGILIN